MYEKTIAVIMHGEQYLRPVSSETIQLLLEGKVEETKRDGLAAACANMLQKSSVVS